MTNNFLFPRLILLFVPVFFGISIKVFSIDRDISFAVIFLSFFIFFISSIIRKFRNRMFISLYSIGLIILCLSFPFWIPGPKISVPKRPIFSYRDAKGDPQAFESWWNFFVSEVVRTNSIININDPKNILPHILRPNAETNFFQGKIKINALGYMGDDFQKEKGNAFRIVAIGESTTFGQKLFPNSQPWPQGLQKLIAQRLVCKRPIQVINGGVNGYVLRDGIERLERDMVWLRPDMVLSYFGYNGVGDIGINSRWIPSLLRKTDFAPPVSLNKLDAVFFQTRKFLDIFSEKIEDFLLSALFFEKTLDDTEMMKEVIKGEYHRQYLRLIEQAKKNNYHLFLLNFNMAVNEKSPEDVLKFYERPFPGISSTVHIIRYHNKLLRIVSSLEPSVSYLDISENIDGEFDKNIFLDVVHFTRTGDDQMAKNIFIKIEDTLLKDDTLGCTRR